MKSSARHALEIGCQIAERFGIHAETRLLRHRHAADGVLQVAGEEQVDAIVLGVGIKTRVPGTDWGRTTEELLQRASCEVIVDKVPMTAEALTLGA